MIKKLKNKNIVNAFVLIMVATILMTPLAAYAAFIQPGIVNGDGVRLRKTPGPNGTILELMYRGEAITIGDEIDHDYSAWIYVRREKTGTTGWMEWSYFVHDWEP